MTNEELTRALADRRTQLKMTLRDIQNRAGLGYNTVRRVFKDPFQCRTTSVLAVVRSMGCDLIFNIENSIGDELEPNTPVEPLTRKDVDDE